MKKVIEGKLYNTATADEICDISPSGFYRGDFRYEDTRLYRTKKGSWFLAGEGGPLSRWSRSVGQNGSSGGEDIRPLTVDEAREYVEQYCDAETVQEYFTVDEA